MVPTAGLPNLILNSPPPFIVERLDLAKLCPPSVNCDMKLSSSLPGGIKNLTESCVSPQAFYGSRRRAGRGEGGAEALLAACASRA